MALRAPRAGDWSHDQSWEPVPQNASRPTASVVARGGSATVSRTLRLAPTAVDLIRGAGHSTRNVQHARVSHGGCAPPNVWPSHKSVPRALTEHGAADHARLRMGTVTSPRHHPDISLPSPHDYPHACRPARGDGGCHSREDSWRHVER